MNLRMKNSNTEGDISFTEDEPSEKILRFVSIDIDMQTPVENSYSGIVQEIVKDTSSNDTD